LKLTYQCIIFVLIFQYADTEKFRSAKI